LSPENEEAKSLLLTGLDHSDFGLRSASACYLWKMGEKERCFPILKAALESIVESGSQSPLHFTGRLGPAAGDLAPAIQPLLFHKTWAIRYVAGKTLQQIAPETFPPVRETPF
jgi:HEAT repeat protein